jgi:hypothetical protein
MRSKQNMIACSKRTSMNSWTISTSYANCIKLHKIARPSDIDEDTWWQLLDITE